ncbi:hypothetical protein EDD16DRAFT_220279 [Pisolithus croceorrhizus]|nr:hypothetical protein EDD16DRAFT_220279 [Pisolithus croceorrhizus]
MLFVLAQAGSGLVTDVLVLINPNDNVATRIMIDSGVPSMALVATADVLIAVSLCVLLYERGSSSAIPSTKRLLNTLIIYTVNRAWATGLDFLVGKLYANSLLATLNSRQHLRFQSEVSRGRCEFYEWNKADRHVRDGYNRYHER